MVTNKWFRQADQLSSFGFSSGGVGEFKREDEDKAAVAGLEGGKSMRIGQHTLFSGAPPWRHISVARILTEYDNL